MQAILITMLIPVLPYGLWKRYNRAKNVKKGEAVLRYFLYILIISFISAAVLAVFSDEDTSFLEKMDRSAGFALKYAVLELGAAILVAFAEWNFLRKKRLIRVNWDQLVTWKPTVLCRKYICPVLSYLLAALVISLNVSLIFDNVVWICVVRQKEEVFVEVHTPNRKNWTSETYSIAAGLFTIAGTICFGYFLCLIMAPVLVQRYMYPLSAVAFCILVVAGARWLTLLGQLGEKTGCFHLKGVGKAVMVCLVCGLLVKGIGNYQDYRKLVWQQNEKTEETLDIIGVPDKDVNMVTNGVKHLGWTVLNHYYPDNKIINGGFDMAESDCFWYFSPYDLGQDTLEEIAEGGVSVTVYGEKQISQYPFYLYYMESNRSTQVGNRR